MKISDTISVNPGKTTLGHVETPSTLFRTQVLGKETTRVSVSKVLFPTTGAGLAEYKKYDVPLRTIFATILIVTGLSILTAVGGIHGTAFAICCLCFGGCLALGFLTRPVMLGAAVFYCISGALAIRANTVDMGVFSLMFGCIIFAVIGSGKYSCDMLIRKAIRKYRKSADKKRKEDMMGYKAFHHIKY